MNSTELYNQIEKKKSFLCVGLDTDLTKIPQHLLSESDPIFAFNKEIIDATAEYCVAYKPNLAFYETYGVAGWLAYEKSVEYIKNNYPEIFIIADAKRGDIGNTSQMYAKAFFELSGVDAVTLSPYMGKDSVEPFLKYENKWAVILALTSNSSASDFETLQLENGKKVYEKVLETSQTWGTTDNIMYVVGATKAEMLADIRKIVPNHFLLVPGVGAQGGSLEEVCKYGINAQCGLLVNSSRGIIYADKSENFAKTAALEAQKIQLQMAEELKAIK
ncbi:MAG: orotidine-5'-phosphate decarboxylase [Rikenellaceae bacterium]